MKDWWAFYFSKAISFCASVRGDWTDFDSILDFDRFFCLPVRSEDTVSTERLCYSIGMVVEIIYFIIEIIQKYIESLKLYK
jgi:hypothetical protein